MRQHTFHFSVGTMLWVSMILSCIELLMTIIVNKLSSKNEIKILMSEDRIICHYSFIAAEWK